ncbi:hypothetical protein PVAND_010346 [Polypedilum vanderplanki]|uniref:Meckelin-like n=1 Tax=Polypedilum vanderplanki TaxID=319348 RepID=A0A9J6CF99_POLVA|nr:hypothetical protein PVAND_010346 [Polypedilum vanderplanki]
MLQKIIVIIVLIVIALTSCTIGNDDDESFYYANNNKFFANNRKSCQLNSIFDVDYFKCRLCDGNFHLMATRQKKLCSCDKNSTEVFEYDNILKRPICEKNSNSKKEEEETKCSIRFVNATNFSSIRKSVRVFRLPLNEKCFCNTKNNEDYRGSYCIKQELLKDLKNYQLYRNLPLTQTLNLNYELKFIVFFCKILHKRDYCNYLANICVLTQYDLDKNGPCYTFYQQQSQQQLGNIDEGGSYSSSFNEGNEFDGGEKMKPFLFFRGRRSNKNLFDKFIDFSYNINNANSTINFTILNYNLHGNLSEMRAMKLSDLDLCNQYTAHAENVKFARNFFSKCTINLREYIALQSNTRFSTLYLNYYENQANFVQTVPILIRNAFKANEEDDIERWQLVKRFFLIDTTSGMISGKNNNDDEYDDELKFYEQYTQINYVKSIELRFHLSDDDDDDENSEEFNKINIPLLIIEYGSMNLTQIAQILKSSNNVDEYQLYNVDFHLKIKFTKRPNLNFFFQIILPIFILIAFFYALMSTFFYKISQQKLEYDLSILLNFIINLMANISNAFFVFILIFIAYVYFVYKSQSTIVKIMLPIEREEGMIEILFAFAIIFKVVKLLKLFFDMITLDIFFIDWERPKAFNTSDHFLHGSNKSHPGTPSITSSLKPTLSSSPSPTNDCVSAWRNYFVANEWQELITKRKISVQLHVIFVIVFLIIFGFENLSSTDFGWFLNATHHEISNETTVADITNENRLLKVATGAMIYLFIYILQRIWNFLVYERFIDNCLQQFIDVVSIANISVLILINNYGHYVHGRSVHGRSDIDTFNMILQFKREEENLCGNRGLLPQSDQQTYTILAPRNLRLFYEKLISPIQNNKSNHYHQQYNKFEQNFEKTMVTYHNINRFFAAFIDHALKDVDYMIKEKNLFEKLFDCELESSNINNESKGIFYIDNGHSFDKGNNILYDA